MKTRGSGPFFHGQSLIGGDGRSGRGNKRGDVVPVGEPAYWPGDSVGQHQEGEGKQEAQQNEQEGAYAPDGGQDADYFVFAGLWFHKNKITAWLHCVNKIPLWP